MMSIRALQFSLLILLFLGCKKQKDTPCVCTREYKPVCAGDTQYANPCMARCAGYKTAEMTFILTQAQIDSGMLVSVDCSQSP